MDLIRSIFTFKYLTEIPSVEMHNALLAFIIFGVSIVIAIILYFLSTSRKVKFEKVFFKRLADGLLYAPVLLILYVFLRYMGIGLATQRIIFLILVLIWLIWLAYLVYYRLVVIPTFVRAYNKKKTDERYISHGKGTK
jgi:ABC-type dipeptide/oligopeptide/nickel transport system permease subunit